MEDAVCTCMAERTMRIKHLKVGNIQVGIDQLDEVMEEVHSMRLPNEEETGEALLNMVKLFNYVAPITSEEYLKSLVEEYRRRYVT